MTVAVYPGSFDPITLGHLDVIGRASRVFDHLVVAVLVNPRKTPLLATDERVAVAREAIAELSVSDVGRRVRIDVEAFEGLTVDFCRAHDSRWVVRGLRAVSDFELELQLAQTNRVLAPEVDAVFFMTALELGYVSSSLAREIATFGGDVSSLVPPAAARALAARFRHPDPVR
jgi:pantetheine-phosphate adenylyltransferase